jgi:hypothetical protein
VSKEFAYRVFRDIRKHSGPSMDYASIFESEMGFRMAYSVLFPNLVSPLYTVLF